MRWKVYYADKKATKEMKETYGFKSNKTPPANELLQPFEDDLFNIVNTLEFRIVNCAFQDKLKKDITEIGKSDQILVSADKTTNFYSVSKNEYKKLIADSITKIYKRAEEGTVEILNKEAKDIAQSLKLGDRIQCMAEKHAFVTLKDHKENFRSNPKCRLLNPAKSEIGIISKNILQKAMTEIKSAVNLNQWRSTAEVIGWFKNIQDKKSVKFVKFDIVEFYPSITKQLVMKCLTFARQYTDISSDEENIILHACKSVLFDENGVWIKKNSDELFDIGMGSYHGAEICELVGLYILSKLPTVFDAGCFGLYRDDGLAVVNKTSQQTDAIRKRLVELFKAENLRITVETNLKITDFLDITLNLNTEKFYPYRKPNDTPLYVHKKSNHPPSIIRQLPIMINKRLSDISHDEDEFDKSVPMYQKALEDSGFQHRLKYIPPKRTIQRNRKRKVIWFNPPYCKSVKTNVGRRFLKLIDKHFPSHHRYHKLFNKNTVKVSYSCLDNIDSKISQHNKKILSPPKEELKKTCSCPKKDKENCPLQGRCLSSSIVYKATVTTEPDVKKHYIGLCETTFKQRLYGHRSAWNAEDYTKSTGAELTKYVWGLLHNKVSHTINWEVVANVQSYQCSNACCYLCLNEKLYIATHDWSSLLNKRSELVSKCRHKNKFLLSNFNFTKSLRKAPT